MDRMERLVGYDSDLAVILDARHRENKDGFSLIASENHPHPEDVEAFEQAVRATFEGGYFEGYPPAPGKAPGSNRYYQGCEIADQLEALTRQRVIAALADGSADAAANVQIPTGAGVNLTTYLALMRPGDTMVAPDLGDGYGHLSHGAGTTNPNIVAKLFNVVGYKADPESGLLDYDEIEELARTCNPRVILAGASSYPRDIDWIRIAKIANAHNAVSIADISHTAGLITAKRMNDPFAAGIDVINSTTHKTLRGMKGAVSVWNTKGLAEKTHKGTTLFGKDGIDFAAFPGIWGGPHMPTIAAHASTFRRAKTPEFYIEQFRIQEAAAIMAEELVARGWNLATGGTSSHLVLADVAKIDGIQNDVNKDGWEAAKALEKVGIVVNKNGIPNTPGTAVRPRAIRLGTPAIVARGFELTEIQTVARLVDETLRYHGDSAKIETIRKTVRDLAHAHPVPAYE